MEEEVCNESFPYLKELENKIGRKTPQSLLIWVRDAADCEDGWRCDEVDRRDRSSAFNGSFSEKRSTLKREMVKIPIVLPSIKCYISAKLNKNVSCLSACGAPARMCYLGASFGQCQTSHNLFIPRKCFPQKCQSIQNTYSFVCLIMTGSATPLTWLHALSLPVI